MTRAPQGRRDGQEGAVAVITALTLTLLLLFSAFVIDLGALRADRALNQSVSDMAAAAAAQAYEPAKEGSAREACQQAVAYVNANLEGVAFGDADCDVFPADEVCDPGVVRRAIMESEPFTLLVVNPVLDDDGDGLMQSLSFEEVDGEPCDRIGVRVSRTRDFLVAPAVGVGSSSSTSAGAVGRASPGDDEVFAALVVLERQGCESIASSGQGHIDVKAGVHPDTGAHLPGVITVDAIHDNCGSNKPVIYSNQSGAGGEIFAEDRIHSYGLSQVGAADEFRIYYEDHIPHKLSPRPQPGSFVTRAPVDHLVNCLDPYPTGEIWSPAHARHAGWPVDGCDSADGDSHIEPLHGSLQELADPDGAKANLVEVATLNAAGWSVFPEDFGGDASCSGADASGVYGPDHQTGVGSGKLFYINCANNGPGLFRPEGLQFDGVETVVSRNRIAMTSSNEFRVRGRDHGTVLYLQQGGIDSGGTLDLQDTFVYIHDGLVDQSGGVINWTAPGMGVDAASAACGASSGLTGPDWPTATCYRPLALWSNYEDPANSDPPNEMGGGAAMDLRGTFFTPNSTFRMSGNTDYTLDRAQFFAAVLENFGQGSLVMVSNADGIPVPVAGGGLIR